MSDTKREMVPALAFQFLVDPPRAWNIGVLPAEGTPIEEPKPTLAYAHLPGDPLVRFATGSLEARLMIVASDGLIAVLTPEQVAAVAKWWLQHDVELPGLVAVLT